MLMLSNRILGVKGRLRQYGILGTIGPNPFKTEKQTQQKNFLLGFNSQNHSHFASRPFKMTIKYLFLVNKQGQTRISKYYESVPVENRVAMEADIIRKCLSRNDTQVRINILIRKKKQLETILFANHLNIM